MILNEILGVEKGVRQRANKVLGNYQKELGREAQLNGYAKRYRPANEGDTDLMPDEGVLVQVRATEILDKIAEEWTDMMDVVFTREVGNTQAKADIKVGDLVVASDVPVGYLMFLEKQFEDMLSIINSIPVLDPSESWEWDEGTRSYRSSVQVTRRTVKTPKSFVKAPATDKFAAQVEVFYEDELKGYYDRVKFSGAMKADDVHLMRKRVTALLRAVKAARERANTLELEQKKIGKAIFDFVLAPE